MGREAIELLNVTPEETRLRFNMGEWSLREVTYAGRQWSRIEAPQLAHLELAGYPAVPVGGCELLVAGNSRLVVEAVSEQEVVCPPPLPATAPVLHGESSGPGMPGEVYEEHSCWPTEVARLTVEYRFREARGRGLVIQPFRYDFERGVLLVTNSVTLAVRSDGATAEDYEVMASEWNLRVLQQRRFLNAALLRGVVAPEPARLLVIAPDEWAESTADFCVWKARLGHTVSLATYPADTGEGATSVAAYVKSAYQNSGITHLVLCGDVADVPPAHLSEKPDVSTNISVAPTSDSIYGLVDGEDYVLDIFVSRVPASSSAQLANVLSKLIAYEAEPPMDDAWRTQGIFLASDQKAQNKPYKGLCDYDIMEQVRSQLLTAGIYEEPSPAIYAKKMTDAQIHTKLTEALNAGGATMFYLGHGSSVRIKTGTFSNKNAAALSNGMNLPYLFLPVCGNGNFAYTSEDCVAEAFFHSMETNGASHGAVAVLASTSDTYWNPPIYSTYVFANDLCAAYQNTRLTSFGGYAHHAVQEGATFSETISPGTSSGHTGLEYAYYYVQQMVLFGDCSGLARLAPLRELKVSVAKNKGSLSVRACWQDGTAAPGALVSLLDGTDAPLASAVIDEDGNAQLALDKEYGICTLLVNDALARPFSMTVELDNTFDLPLGTLLRGEEVSLLAVPELEGEVSVLSVTGTIPPGLELMPDGWLVGVPEALGYFSFQVHFSLNGQPGFTASCTATVLSPADANEDGMVSHQEILAWLEQWSDSSGDKTVLDDVVADWVNSGSLISRSEKDEVAVATGILSRVLPTHEAVVAVSSEAGIAGLEAAGVEIVAAWEGFARIRGNAEVFAALADSGWALEQVQEIPAVQQMRGGLYFEPDELNTQLQLLALNHPEVVRLSYVGTTNEGREILAIRLSALPEEADAPELLVAGTIHGDERPAMMLAWRLAVYLAEQATADEQVKKLLDNAIVWIVPTCNPDGVAKVSRYNANGVDLNRNFPDGVELDVGNFQDAAPMHFADTNSNGYARQVETLSLMRWCAMRRFAAALHLHTGDTLVCYPYGNHDASSSMISPDNLHFQSLSRTYAEGSGYIETVQVASLHYKAIGEFADWMYRCLGTLAITVELTGGKGIGKELSNEADLDSLWEDNRPAFLAWMTAACTGLSLRVCSSATGLPIQDVRVQVQSTHPVFTDAQGFVHKTLMPGYWPSITVKANGFAEASVPNITVSAGKTESVEVALVPDGTVLSMNFEEPRYLPMLSNELTLQPRPDSSVAMILNLANPSGWKVDGLEGYASRKEADGSRSVLKLAFDDELETALVLKVVPNDLPLADHIVSAQCITSFSSVALARHWLTAEPRRYSSTLPAGGALWGTTVGTHASDLPEGTQVLVWMADGWQPTVELRPGHAYWVEATQAASVTIDGWSGDTLWRVEPGWNLRCVFWPTMTSSLGTPAYGWDSASGSYVQVKTLSTGQVVWVFSRE